MNSHFGKRLRTHVAACVLAGTSMVAATAHASTTLVINSFLPPGDPINVQVLRPWAADVARVTDGRVKISIPPATVAPPDQLWSAVTGDIVDGAYFFNGFYAKQLPLEQIAGLPFTSGSTESTSVALWKTYEKFFAKAGDYRQFKLLGLFTVPAGQIFSMTHPIVEPADLKGMRLWVLPGVPQRMFEHSGAGVVSNAAVHVSELVSGGTIDGVVGIGAFSMNTFKVLPYMKSETRVDGGLSSANFSLVVNRSRWNSIAPADRKAIEQISGLAFAHRFAALDKADESATQKGVRDGMKLLKPSPALESALQQWGAPLRDAWLASAKSKGVDGALALRYFETTARHD